MRSTSSRARRSFLDTVEIFRRQHGANLSFADTAIVHVAKNRADGLVATFGRDYHGFEGISVLPGEGDGRVQIPFPSHSCRPRGRCVRVLRTSRCLEKRGGAEN